MLSDYNKRVESVQTGVYMSRHMDTNIIEFLHNSYNIDYK